MSRSSTTRIVPRPRAETAAGPRATPGGAPPGRRSVALVVGGVLALALSVIGCEAIGSAPWDEAPPASPTSLRLAGRVIGVADGDTIRVELGGMVERVRIIGLDTPEVDAELRTPACYGEEASAFAEATLDGRTVTLELDPTQDQRDRFGRLLAHVRTDSGLYAVSAIEGGYGIHYVHDQPSLHAAELQAAEDAARRAGAGLWSACAGRVDLPLASP